MMKLKNSRWLFTSLLTLFAVLGFCAVILAPQQLGAGPDSFAYVSAARSFAAGEGLRSITWDGRTEVMTHFPPLYSLLLAGFGLGQAPLLAAKWLNALAFAGSIFLIGLILRRLTGYVWIALAGAVTFLTSDMALHVHFNIWTEALFVFFMLATVYCLGLYAQASAHNTRRTFLLLTAVWVGLATLTRYVGVTIIGVTALVILLSPAVAWRRRVFDAGLFTAVSCVPLILWLGRNALVAESVTNRVIAYHAVQWDNILNAVYTFSLWLLPGVQVSLTAGVIFLLLLAVAIGLKRPFRQPIAVQVIWCTLFVAGYLAFLLFSLSFIDAHTSLGYRILFPVYVISLIILFAGLASLLPSIQKIPFVRVLPLGAFLAHFTLNVMAGQQILTLFYEYGMGYTAVSWQDSELMAQTFLLADSAKIYTNVPDAIYFARDEVVTGVPVRLYATSLEENLAYDAEMAEMLTLATGQEAVVVYFNRIARWYLPTEEELVQTGLLTAVFQNKEGTIYKSP